jgi:hypothetical protein
MKPKHPRANEIMFFMITVPAFLARVDPTSTRVAPASIKRIKKEDRRVQTMSMAAGWWARSSEEYPFVSDIIKDEAKIEKNRKAGFKSIPLLLRILTFFRSKKKGERFLSPPIKPVVWPLGRFLSSAYHFLLFVFLPALEGILSFPRRIRFDSSRSPSIT